MVAASYIWSLIGFVLRLDHVRCGLSGVSTHLVVVLGKGLIRKDADSIYP